MSAEKRVNISVRLRKRKLVRSLVFLCALLVVILELVFAAGFQDEVQKSNLDRLVFQELQIRTTGQIRLPSGVYRGQTDLGLLQGD